MDERTKKANAHSHGFVWGLLIGGGLMYLISTPNGRRILKEVSEGGIEKLADVIDLEKLNEIKQAIGEDFELDEEEFEGVEQNAQEELQSLPNPRKRLFRGIKKR